MAAKKSTSVPAARRRGGAGGMRWLRHRNLVATEALLLAGLCKDWLTGAVERSDLANWGKVVFVMGATVGLFGGVFLALQRLLELSVARTHSAFGGLPFPTLGAHALVLFGLFLVYANHLGLSLW
jgi:hypothetical protein